MRTPIEKIRRVELAEAAFVVLTEYGFAGTTVSRVAKCAGMSQGLIHHYFKSKSDLLEAAMRRVNARYRDYLLERVRQATTPREKLYAVAEAAFPPDMFGQKFAQAWLSFCGEAAFTPRYARVQRVMFRRMQSNLACYLRMLLPADRVKPAALTISMLSHGIWLRCALDAEPMSRDEALTRMYGLLDSLLASEASAAR